MKIREHRISSLFFFLIIFSHYPRLEVTKISHCIIWHIETIQYTGVKNDIGIGGGCISNGGGCNQKSGTDGCNIGGICSMKGDRCITPPSCCCCCCKNNKSGCGGGGGSSPSSDNSLNCSASDCSPNCDGGSGGGGSA